MERINTMNIDKFAEAIAFIGEGPCTKFECPNNKNVLMNKSNVKRLDIGSIMTRMIR